MKMRMWGTFDLKELRRLHPEPSRRSFGILLLVVLGLAGWHWNSWSLYFFAGLAFFLGLRRSPYLYWPLRLWHNLGLFLGWLTAPVILRLLYFAVLCPTALIVKRLGHQSFAPVAWRKAKDVDFRRAF